MFLCYDQSIKDGLYARYSERIPFEILRLRDVHTITQIKEYGDTPEDNARKKAQASL